MRHLLPLLLLAAAGATHAGEPLITDDASILPAAAETLGSLEPWEVQPIKDALQGLIGQLGLHRKRAPKAMFVAISGKDTALPLFESIYLIGREESVARLRGARA